MKLIFNPFTAEFKQNPYPNYAKLRKEDPIHWSLLNAWVITRYDDIQNLLKDSRLQVDDLPLRIQHKSSYLKQGDLYTLAQTVDKWLFFQKAPDHTRLKGLVSKVFSPSNVESMRPLIQETVNDLLNKVKPDGKIDLIKDLASPLPALTIANILGLPSTDFEKLIRWSHDLFFVFDQPMSLEGYQRQNEIAIEAREYLLDFMAHLRQDPNQGLISKLQRLKDRENALSEDEILGFCIMLLIVGQETTKSLIGNAILALLKYPDKLAQLKHNPEITNQAVEELLRYDTPVQVVVRIATEEVKMRDKTIRQGDKLILCLGAANRDPDQFPEPDLLNWQRPKLNLPFGGGIHFCLGAFLARVQGQIAIKTIVQDLANIQLATDKLDWRESISLRGLKSLPLTFHKIPG